MNILEKIILRSVGKAISRMPISVLELMEEKSAFQLGKGWGAESTTVEAKVIAKLVASKRIQKVFALDVGANLGHWSAALLEEIPSAQLAAFEPSREAYLSINKRFFNLPNVYTVNSALGNIKGHTTLYADRSGSGLGSLTKRRLSHFNLDFAHQETVDIQTLDSWWQNEKKTFTDEMKPNVLKLDVEGHELDVLQGALTCLADIQIVQFEFGGCNIDTRTFFQDFWYFFTHLEFDLFRLGPKGLIKVSAYTEIDESFRTTNYYAVRP
jgi:FkbM family methyltransferase